MFSFLYQSKGEHSSITSAHFLAFLTFPSSHVSVRQAVTTPPTLRQGLSMTHPNFFFLIKLISSIIKIKIMVNIIMWHDVGNSSNFAFFTR